MPHSCMCEDSDTSALAFPQRTCRPPSLRRPFSGAASDKDSSSFLASVAGGHDVAGLSSILDGRRCNRNTSHALSIDRTVLSSHHLPAACVLVCCLLAISESVSCTSPHSERTSGLEVGLTSCRLCRLPRVPALLLLSFGHVCLLTHILYH